MEEGSKDWQINEKSSSEGGDGKAAWVLKKGLTFGKNIVITGALVSSAPLVLPSIVVISAISFALCFPFGFAYVSYACTERLMSKLLPMPTCRHMLEYETDTYSEEDVGDKEEEKELDEIIMEGSGVRIESDEEVDREPELGSIGMRKRTEMYKQQSIDDEEEGYEEDDEDLEEEDKGTVGALECLGNKKEQKSIIVERKDEEFVDEYCRAVDEREVSLTNGGGENKELIMGAKAIHKETIAEEKAMVGGQEELAIKTSRLLKRMGKEGWDSIVIEEGYQVKKLRGVAKEDQRDESAKEGIGKSFADTNLEQKNLIEKITMSNGRKKDEIISDVVRLNQSKKLLKYENVGLDKSTKERRGFNGEEKSDIIIKGKDGANFEIEKPFDGNVKHATDVESVSTSLGDQKYVKIGKVEVVEILPAKETRMQGAQVKKMGASMLGDLSLERRRENITHSDADKGVMADEIDLDLIDKKENENLMESQSIDFPTASEKDGFQPSNEMLFSEKKIWEQIYALRTIVGYKAAPQLTCIGELKALYIFTGVEPPSTSEDTLDLRETNEKLHFLMSVIGVK